MTGWWCEVCPPVKPKVSSFPCPGDAPVGVPAPVTLVILPAAERWEVVFPHLTGPAERAMGTASQWSHSWLSVGLCPCGSRIREAGEAGGREQGEGPGETAEPGSRPFLQVLSYAYFFIFFNRHFLPAEDWLQIPCCTHSVTPCIWPLVRAWNGAAHFADQQTVPLRELIRKAHCTPHTYPGPGSPWQSHGKRTVTLSMAGNLGVRTEQIVGCFGLEAHFCHQICWATLEKLLDPSQSPWPNP